MTRSGESRLSRRSLLRASLISGAGALLAACSPSTTAAPTQAPAKPTAAPTVAPAAATAAPTTAAPAPTAAAAAKPTTAAANAALPDLHGQEITIAYTSGTPSQLEDLSKEFETRTGLKFNRVALPYGDLYDKLVINLTQGTGLYDLTVADGPWVPLFAGKQYIQPLDPFFEKAGLKGLDSDFVPSAVTFSRWPAGSDSGNIVGVDFNGNVQLYTYRKDLLEKYGLPAPKTWDDVYNFAKQVKQKESGMYGYVMRGKATNPAVSAFLPCFWGHGADVFDANYMPQFTSDNALAALEFWVKMANEVAPTGVASFDSTQVTNSLSTGESAQSMVWPSWASDIDNPQKSQTAGKWAWATAPEQPGAKGGPMMGNWLLVIPKGAKNPDPAFQFLLWATSAEAEKLAALNDASPPTRTSVYKDQDVLKKYPYYSSLYENLQVARQRPQITNWGAVEDALGTQISGALAGESSPKDAFNNVQQKVIQLMKKEGYLK